MHGVYWVNIENALRWEESSFVIRRRYVYVAAARPHERTTQYCIRGMRSLPVAVLCRYMRLVPVDQGCLISSCPVSA